MGVDPVYGDQDLEVDELPDHVKVFNRSKFSAQVDLSKFTLASAEDKEQHIQMRPPSTFLKDGMAKFRKNKLAMASAIILIFIIVMIIIAPLLVPYSYSDIVTVNGRRDKTAKNLPPFHYSELEQQAIEEGEKIFPHIFGTDELGRDYFIRVIYGTRVSIVVGSFASLIVLVIGLLYGSISGYFGGKVDLVMMRLVDIIYSLPDLLLVILLSVVLDQVLTKAITGTILKSVGTNMISLFIVFALLYWVSMARLVRGQILSVKQNEYVLAARSMGASSGRIIRKHILPNCMSVIIISTALQVPSAIFTESYLSFLGLGVQAPMPSLGSLANKGREAIQSYPHKLIFPSIMICLIVLSFNLFGDGLRDAFDPKLRK
ncbi:MAG: ABC transporter permease [Clostridiaceae bacterium]|nr:ABC transporter permease [Clostridiaceae bacterium]